MNNVRLREEYDAALEYARAHPNPNPTPPPPRTRSGGSTRPHDPEQDLKRQLYEKLSECVASEATYLPLRYSPTTDVTELLQTWLRGRWFAPDDLPSRFELKNGCHLSWFPYSVVQIVLQTGLQVPGRAQSALRDSTVVASAATFAENSHTNIPSEVSIALPPQGGRKPKKEYTIDEEDLDLALQKRDAACTKRALEHLSLLSVICALYNNTAHATANVVDVTEYLVYVPYAYGYYTYNGNLYSFAINLDTGSVTGEYPKDPFKIGFTALAAGVAAVLGWYATRPAGAQGEDIEDGDE